MTIEQTILESVSDINPKEEIVENTRLPDCINELKSQFFYEHHELLLEDLKKCYNEGIVDSIKRIKDEYSFMPKRSEYIDHLITILEENLIDM